MRGLTKLLVGCTVVQWALLMLLAVVLVDEGERLNAAEWVGVAAAGFNTSIAVHSVAEDRRRR